MPHKIIRSLMALELEEKILNAALFIAAVSVVLPWIGGDWPGGDGVSYSGFGYSTSFLGIAVFAINLFLLLLTVVPAWGGPVFIKTKRYRELLRVWLTAQSVILVIAALSVLMRVSALEFTRLEVRYGIYICLAASIVALFEACQRYVGFRKVHGSMPFHHPEDQERPEATQETMVPPPPPPPPPPAPPLEEHRIYP